MVTHRGWRIRWHRFYREHGMTLFVVGLVVVVLVLVAGLMYYLTSPNWRPR